jgi:hypothetical protein
MERFVRRGLDQKGNPVLGSIAPFIPRISLSGSSEYAKYLTACLQRKSKSVSCFSRRAISRLKRFRSRLTGLTMGFGKQGVQSQILSTRYNSMTWRVKRSCCPCRRRHGSSSCREQFVQPTHSHCWPQTGDIKFGSRKERHQHYGKLHAV